MLWSDRDLVQALDDGEVTITPFNKDQVQPASYDVLLGKDFRVMRTTSTSAVFPRDRQAKLWESQWLSRPNEAFVLHPGGFALATTLERFELSDSVAAQVGGKSSLGRLGLVVHATAGFIDPGFRGTITLELSNVSPLPIMLYAEMPVAQVTFLPLATPCIRPYSGKYLDQAGTTEPRYYENFENDVETGL